LSFESTVLTLSEDGIWTRRSGVSVGAIRKLRGLATMAALGATVLLLPGTAQATSSSGSGTVISTTSSPFGEILVVGSGQYAGYTVYFITSDVAPNYGCTTTVQTLPGFPGPGSCTGPEADTSAEWPAVTTTGAPVAGAGVKQSLLGTVSRPGIGEQVTYAGHPLYLFDTGPNEITGEGWDEPGLPPWHGIWYVVSPKGTAVPWTPMLTTTTLPSGRKVLAVSMLTGGGWQAVPVYSDSAKAGCTGSCAVVWPPVLTSGQPGVAATINAAVVGTQRLASGLLQVTYNGHPLYLYGDETPVMKAGNIVIVGNGNGKKAGGGTFRLLAA
jgi:predicted lipoprotein with Yx(FWY)xxD motif